MSAPASAAVLPTLPPDCGCAMRSVGKFAPYVGMEWHGLYGDTADLARAAGEDARDTRLVAGLRFWF